MNFDVKNKKQFFCASGNARSAASSAIDLANIAVGQVVLSPMNGKTLEYFSGSTAYDAYDTMQIVENRNGVLKFSTPIKYNKVRSYLAKAYAADTQKIAYVGYNGVSGQIEGTANIITATNYNITLRKLSKYTNFNDKYLANKPAGYYSGDTTTITQKDLATGLYEECAVTYSGSIDGYVKAELVYSGTATALGNSNTLTVVNGSNIATLSTTGSNVAVGDYLRIGGTALTTPVYKVSGVSGTTVTLSTPYTGTSATVANANVLEIDNTTTGNWGIKFTTVEKIFSVGKFYYDLFDFDIWLNNAFVNTDITYATVKGGVEAAVSTTKTSSLKGIGVGNEVYEMDWQNEYFERAGVGEYNMPPMHFIDGTNASTSVNYDLVVLEVENDTPMFATGTHTQYSQIVIAIPAAGSNTTTQGDSHTSGYSEGIVIGLDEWLTAKTGTTVSQVGNLTV